MPSRAPAPPPSDSMLRPSPTSLSTPTRRRARRGCPPVRVGGPRSRAPRRHCGHRFRPVEAPGRRSRIPRSRAGDDGRLHGHCADRIHPGRHHRDHVERCRRDRQPPLIASRLAGRRRTSQLTASSAGRHSPALAPAVKAFRSAWVKSSSPPSPASRTPCWSGAMDSWSAPLARVRELELPRRAPVPDVRDAPEPPR